MLPAPLRALSARAVLAVLLLLATAPVPVLAQTGGGPAARSTVGADSLAAALRESRMAVTLRDGRLEGPGADFLLREGRAAGFFLVGEDHGIAQVPQLTGALFRALAPDGYRHLVIETSPLLAHTLEGVARGAGTEPVMAYGRTLHHPLEIPFYGLREEARMLEEVVRAAGGSDVLWGVDQEFIGSSPSTFAWLAEHAPSDSARRVALAMKARAEAGMDAAVAGSSRAFFLATAADSDFVRLAGAFRASPEAARVVEEMRESRDIYRLYFTDQGYRSNVTREALIRRNLRDHLRRADAAPGGAGKVMVKMGAAHAVRGQKLTDGAFSTGNFVSELAAARGTTSFHVMVVGGKGTRATGVGAGMRYQSTDDLAGNEAWVAPVAAQAEPGVWTVFDLRPLRERLGAGKLAAPDLLKQVIWGYDALVVLTGSTPATY
jgi:hypothetical protein